MLALLNPEDLLASGGILLLGAIVFAESGLLIGFFLPGDSLLFIAGFFSSSAAAEVSDVRLSLPLVILVSTGMAIIGDQVGYIIGNKAGPAMFNRPKSRLFDPAHVVKAQSFFDKYGARTIILARFIPIVRTFAPVVAGVGNMHYRTFVRYNIIGGILWGTGLPLLGYFLGQFEIVKNNIEIAVLVVVGISVLPVVIEFINHRRKKSQHSAD
ncbi:MAG: VTT domain-containing protein [Ilumatobacteraceae bacterium]|nr:VTT domain-containing protein [Ilumatobacteraceae bacterium]